MAVGFGFQWHVSDRCNLRCRHCYQDDFSPRSERGIDQLRSMADSVFSGIGADDVSINITGGEPLLVPHLFELIDHLERFRSLGELHIITNGTVSSPRALDALRGLRKLGHLKVSIESADERVNDAIRGEGSFARTLAGIEAFRGAGLSVVLMATLAKHNLSSIPGLVGLARDSGADGVIFERFVPLGIGRGVRDQVLGAPEWRSAVSAIAAEAEIEPDPYDLLPFRAFWLWPGRSGDERLQGALCNLGEGAMALMPDGTVLPCRRLAVPVGNVLQEPFAAIRGRLRLLGSEVLRQRMHTGLCGACGVEGCVGCRALAYATTSDLLADDPQCPLAAP